MCRPVCGSYHLTGAAGFSYLGVFGRLGLSEFSAWWSVEQAAGCELLERFGHGFFLPNIIGCFLMGLAKVGLP
jgi:hypothetical protein